MRIQSYIRTRLDTPQNINRTLEITVNDGALLTTFRGESTFDNIVSFDNINQEKEFSISFSKDEYIPSRIVVKNDIIRFEMVQYSSSSITQFSTKDVPKIDIDNMFLTIKYFYFCAKAHPSIELSKLPLILKAEEEDILFKKPTSDGVIQWLKI